MFEMHSRSRATQEGRGSREVDDLRKREGLRKAFANFDAARSPSFVWSRTSKGLLTDPGIVRNRLKVESTVNNAQRILELDSLSE